jgi:6-pyruvoyltetrahydropterin/6-carboxytetrahydropterin synthase
MQHSPGWARIVRREHFSAAHVLGRPEWSEARNREVFGPCANPLGHGHNYLLEVEVAGPIQPETGMVMNLRDLKQVLEREVLSKVDHRHLNQEVDFLHGINPTTENLARAIWEVLRGHLPAGCEHRVRIFETERNSVEYPA